MYPPSRLALFCEKFIQACWLIALIVAPLFFNIYSSRVFEPDKIALVRTLALAMGAAWLILRAERWRGKKTAKKSDAPTPSLGQQLRAWVSSVSTENPLTLPALLLFLAYIISTLLSVSPTVSFFGSYQRLQGLYTYSSYLVIFFLAASQIKTRADVERAITIALLASFPIALYGIIQHYFVDPLPWVGDVTTRVASNLGNSIFIGAYLILTIPLAIGRLIRTGEQTAAQVNGPTPILIAAIATVLAAAAVWGLAFDVTAKPIIEAGYTGTLTPAQLVLASSSFNVALILSFLIILAWWGAAFFLKQRASDFLLTGLYSSLLAVQLVALLFSQSRGPLLGLLGGLFIFGVLFAIVRGARKLAAGMVAAAAVLLIFLAVLNIPESPMASLRQLPYLGRLGRVFELEGGTGRVRVLIWQGALQLVLPHEPLWSPLTGNDAFNPIRPLVGYGPETMYVSYNRFYPPELGTLESRNATPDRSHNETFDALVTTGILGFAAENLLFLLIFYFSLKWLGLVPSSRARNLFLALWFGGGILFGLLFGVFLGWEFIGVALPGGMMLGMFIYLVAAALRAGRDVNVSQPNLLWLITLTALFVSHFIEIHFGIAIVSTRLYFWFFAAVFVVIGTRRVDMDPAPVPIPASDTRPAAEPVTLSAASAPARRKKAAPTPSVTARKPEPQTRRVSTAPLILLAFLVGFIIAVMGYDYINTNNLGSTGTQQASGLDIVLSALTIKNTTAGGQTSLAMLWLMVATLALGLGISAAEWGRGYLLSTRDWAVAVVLFVVLAFAIFSGLAFYHILLIATVGATVLDALLTAVIMFTVFMLLVAVICAITLLFDEHLPAVWFNRTTNYVVAPVLVLVALALILATNIEQVRADILYKQAASQTGQNNASAIQLFQRALGLQPQQDYYYLFLGRAYLEAAKATPDTTIQAEDLKLAAQVLNRAREINPYNTDHSANLARLAQARGALALDPSAQIESYQLASEYFTQANRLSPNTAHLYDQHAQALLEFAVVLEGQHNPEGAAAVRGQARDLIQKALAVDATFCLSHAVSSQAQSDWQARTADALNAIRYGSFCDDTFRAEALSISVNQLAQAGDEAIAANQGAQYEQQIKQTAADDPNLEIYTTLANFYSKQGRVPEAIEAVDGAIAVIPIADTTTRQRYQDFRFTLVELQKALEAVESKPNEPELQRIVANLWLQRGQLNFALPAYQRILDLKPDDYAAQRTIALLLIASNQLSAAAQQIPLAEKLAPDTDKLFWQQLATLVNDIEGGNTEHAAPLLEQLATSADSNDFALVSALRKLAEKLRGAG